MSNLFEIFLVHKFKIVILILFSLILLGLYNSYEESSRHYVLVKFAKSGPLYKGIPVFFKGYQIGKIQKVTLSDDYKFSLVKIVLFPKNPQLPKEIEAVVKKHDVLRSYVDLVPADETSTEILGNGETIEGTPMFDIGAFLAEISDSGLLIPLIQNFSDTAVSLNDTSNKIGNFFSDSNSILDDNRQNLKNTTASLNKITSNFNTSFGKDKLENTTTSVEKSATNIQEATENIKNITRNVDCATKNLDQTIAKIDSTLAEAHATTSNTKVITCGFREILGKRFAGLRIIFGKPLR